VESMSDLTLPAGGAPTGITPRLALRDIGGIARRNLLRIVRTPQLLVVSIAQPTIILLLLRYVLGGAIRLPGLDYVNFVVPAIFIEAVLIGGMTTALALAQDLEAGIIDRFRSLPMARSAFLAGRTLADLSRNVLALGFIIGLGALVGFRFHDSLGACLAGIALIIGFGYSFTWVYATVGLAVRDPQTAQMAALLPMFILFFASSAVVPVSTMPGWLQPFARNQPASVVINTVRELFEGGPVSHDLWLSVMWCAGLFVVFLVVALNLYRKATT
jgi:ABC transporter DrrB family efflux protein